MQNKLSLIPYGEDPLDCLARQILEDFSASLPDLTQVTVLLSEAHAAKNLRRSLLKQAELKGYQAILCPQISNIRDWASIQFNSFQKKPYSICSQYQRELILFEVLTKHPQILGNASPWHLTDDLLKLFDQLTLNQKTLPENYDDFENEIAAAYGLTAENFPALGREATLVHTLWYAWHNQLNALNLLDSEAAYLLGLNHDIKNNSNRLYIAGYHQFSKAEQSWLIQLIEQDRCYLILHGQSITETDRDSNNENSYHPDTPITDLLNAFHINPEIKPVNNYTHFINTCYQHNGKPYIDRVNDLNQTNSENSQQEDIKNKLKLLFSQSNEEQAHAVEFQVRRWLIEGKQNIGIVTENRKLARRVRALLERADVLLQDFSGWALSTTRAGAVIERWLQCIEEDFSFLPLLDLLKSPFIFNDLDSQQLKHATYRLEHDIIRQENIAQSLQRYKKSIHSRAEKLQWSSEVSELLLEILNRLESTAKLLKSHLKGQHSASEFLNNLSLSLEQLGMLPLLQQDAAGVRVIEMLDTLKASAQKVELNFNWADFRTWVGRSLEQFVFTPELADSPVSLMGLGQSRLQKFDALIIASAEQEHLPGRTNHTPFFNNAVREQLNLVTTKELLTERFHHFRRLLESADSILITANIEENGEAVPLSPWLEIIHHFYQQAFSHDDELQNKISLHDDELKNLIAHPATQVKPLLEQDTELDLPKSTTQAKVSVPNNLIPRRYSPSSYQKLMDCPYQFFASQCLSLSPNEEVQQALSKSDYGERVHKCLEAFHHDVNHLPGPFKEIINETNSDAATKMLNEIAQQVFARDLEDNFEHAAWLEQWLKRIPEYINWQIKHAEEWQIYKIENRSCIDWKNISNIKTELKGRLDRVDKNTSGLNIIDYKTGKSASIKEIESGEAVQLPFYALLAEEEFNKAVTSVSYLNLENKVKTAASLSDDALQTISQQIANRLDTLITEMADGAPLTAWGDEASCQYCDMSRLCRKQAW